MSEALHCGAGARADALLELSYDVPGGTSASLSIPFQLECLDELIFDGDTSPSPLPPNTTVQVLGRAERIINFAPDSAYRFSRVEIGHGGVLQVHAAAIGDPMSAMRLEVTSDMIVDGTIRARGEIGKRGGNGRSNDDPGKGKAGGAWGGGLGGNGGPTGLAFQPLSLLTYWRHPQGYSGFPGEGPYGGAGGEHGWRWSNASWVSVLGHSIELGLSLGTATQPWDYISVTANAYDLGKDIVKLNDKDENEARSAGGGGRAGRASGAFEGPSWWLHPPVVRPGGGGGGSGLMEIDYEPDSAGAGGGGGGGAAPNVEIIAGGTVTFATGGSFDGPGGDGGRGGNGSGNSWTDQAAPGGGGAGGSGAGLHIAARLGLRNNGVVELRGGRGNISGHVKDNDEFLLMGIGFGAHGPDGEMRRDGLCFGTCGKLASRGAFFREYAPLVSSSWAVPRLDLGSPTPEQSGPVSPQVFGLFTKLVNQRDAGSVADDICQRSTCEGRGAGSDWFLPFTLEEGLNVLSLRRGDLGVEPHPWLRGYVFHFEGLGDADGDGLRDRAEQVLGTDPDLSDSDDDGLDDFDEAMLRHTDPIDADTDGDGFEDGLEVDHDFDPLDPNDHALPLPTIVSVSPQHEATAVSVGMPITIAFSEAMDPSATHLTFSPAVRLLAPRWSSDGRTLMLAPNPAFAFHTHYEFTVEGADLEAYPLGGTVDFEFTTESAPAPLAADGVVRAFAAGSDGTVYLGGDFTRVGRRTGGAVPLDAVTGALLEPFPEVPGPVECVAPDGHGGFWLGGAFSAVGELPREGLAHVLADGSVDPAFDADLEIDTWVRALVATAQHVVIADDTTVRAFDPSTGAEIWDAEISGAEALVEADGTLYVAGNMIDMAANAVLAPLIALDAGTGQLLQQVAGFGEGAWVQALAWSGDTLYVGGVFDSVDGVTRRDLAAFDASLALTAFDAGISADSYGVRALSWHGGQLYFAGAFTQVGGQPRIYLAAVDASGAVTDWNPYDDPGNHLYDVVATDAAVYVAGNDLLAYDLAGARLPWSPRPLANPNAGEGLARALAVDGNVVYAGGAFVGLGGEERNGLAALDVRGELLPWNPGPGAVSALAVTGSRVAAITPYMGVQAFDAASGVLAWEVASDSLGGALASDGGLLYVGGAFHTMGGVARAGLAALEANGAVAAWNPETNDTVLMLAARNGVVLAQGSFTAVGGQLREGLAAIASSGEILPWAARVPIAYALTATDAFVYLGTAISVNDELTGDGGLVKLDLGGNQIAWSPILPAASSAPSQVFALAADDATVYVGGAFGWGNLGNDHNLAALATSGEPLPWRHIPNNAVRSLFLQGSRLWVGGEFSSMRDYPAQGFTMIER